VIVLFGRFELEPISDVGANHDHGHDNRDRDDDQHADLRASRHRQSRRGQPRWQFGHLQYVNVIPTGRSAALRAVLSVCHDIACGIATHRALNVGGRGHQRMAAPTTAQARMSRIFTIGPLSRLRRELHNFSLVAADNAGDVI
jgi:hypothetical protein